MLPVNKIPHLRIYRQKMILPYDQQDKKKGSLIIANTKTFDGIQYIISNDKLDVKSNYLYVYMDRYISTVVGKRKVVKNFKDERDTKYNSLRSLPIRPILKGVVENQLANGYNMYYNISTLNELYFTNTGSLNIQVRAEGYLDFIASFINVDKFSKYSIKTMMINIDEWTTDIDTDIKSKQNLNNPISCIYFTMLKNPEKIKVLGNMDLIFYNTKGEFLRLNTSEFNSEMFKKFRTELFKMNSTPIVPDQSDAERLLTVDKKKKEVTKSILSSYCYGFEGEIPQEIQDKLEEKIEEVLNEDSDADEEDIKVNLEEDEELIKSIYKMSLEEKTGKPKAASKRDEELRKRQMELKLENMTLKQIIEKSTKEVKIEAVDVSSKVSTTNSNITQIKFPNIDKAYNEELAQKDLVNIILDLNNKEIPIFVRSIKKEDSSDLLNYKDTYRIELEDANRVRHTLTFDVPKFIDDKFLYLGGNRKMLVHQQMMLPIAKTNPDTVQTCTNYNKIFVTRYGTKVSSDLEKFKKVLAKGVKDVSVKNGNYLKANSEYITTLDYDDLSQSYKEIKVGSTYIIFDQKAIRDELKKRNVPIPNGHIPIGFNKDKYLFLDINNQTVVEMLGSKKSDLKDTDFMLTSYICSLSPILEKEVGTVTAGKKYIYTRATIMKKKVPIALLLAYFEGISGFLKRAGIKHYFSDTRPRVGSDEGIVQFNNGYLVYEKYPFKNSLLMNAFADVPTKAFDYEDFETKSIYASIFEVMFSRRNIANAFDNFYDNFVDPITLEVLNDLNLPTDITGILLYANELLADNQYTKETDMSLYRIRCNEVVNGVIYQEISKAYEKYKATCDNANPQKISVPRDIIIKKLQTLPTVEDYSVLNPIVELEKARACTPKGLGGCNLKESYSLEKRSFDDSMMGMYTISTSPDANCGVVRELVTEPNIVSPRGYMKLEGVDNVDDLKDVNLFGYAEMLSPLGACKDDSTRTAMSTKQAKHVVPVKKSSPVLISNGAEQTIHYHIGKDFTFVAKEDGEIVELDEKLGLVVVKYKSGKTEAFDINTKIVKNGAGGFYLANQLQTKYKQGQKFKKNDVIASDKNFFTDSEVNGNRFNIGSLQKVAICSSYATYEDSSFITKKLSRDMASEVVMDKGVVLGKNTTIEYMAKVGQEVKVGDELLIFERSFNEDSLNDLLASVGDELKEEIKMTGKDKVKTKYSGKIVDIKIYSTVELDELSPSLRKVVSEYYNTVNKKRKLLDKHDTEGNPLVKCGMLFNEPSGKVEAKNNKIKGYQVGEGVLIEFFIQYYDEMKTGDKLTFFTALKSIVGEVVEEGKEPYTLFRPEEEISSVIAPAAVIARGTPSIILTMLGNKVLVELKRSLKDIYDGKK